MDFIRRVTEHDMIAAFVRAEFDTRACYREAIRGLGVDRTSLVDSPDLSDERANEQRAFLLGCRGYPTKGFSVGGRPASIGGA